MTINQSALLLGLVLALPLATGCKKPEEGAPTPSTTETEVPGTASSTDLSPTTAQARVDEVTVGHALAPDGKVASDKTGDEFAPGRPLFVAMSVGDAPASSAIKVVWYGPNESRVGEETKTVATGETTLNFAAGDTSSWPLGDYRVEVWIGDENVSSQDFQLVEAAKADG